MFVPLALTSTAFLLLLTSVLASPSPVLKARQTQAIGTPLYLDEPSCDSYQCAVTKVPGDTLTAHWLDAPAGNVILTMLSRTSNIPDQNVATVPGTTTNCNAEGQSTCGQFSWIVPSSWIGGNFTLQANSQNDASIASYTDTILIQANPNDPASIPFRAIDPTAGASSTASSPSSTAAPSATTPAGASSSAGGSATSRPSASATTSSTPASGSSTNGGSTQIHSATPGLLALLALTLATAAASL